MKMILFVNDSYFAYLLAKPIITHFYKDISLIVFSTRIKGSLSQVLNILRKTIFSYFIYRSLIDISSRLNKFRNKLTVLSLAKNYNIDYSYEPNINKSSILKKYKPLDVGLAFNFDQILKDNLLNLFNIGVINIHASKLPRDKGISPTLWAFARGDEEIWVSIYKMDGGIDTGKIYQQFSVKVQKDDTAFSIYHKVCHQSGQALVSIVERIIANDMPANPQPQDVETNYNNWPDRSFSGMMRKSGRKFLKIKDLKDLFTQA